MQKTRVFQVIGASKVIVRKKDNMMHYKALLTGYRAIGSENPGMTGVAEWVEIW